MAARAINRVLLDLALEAPSPPPSSPFLPQAAARVFPPTSVFHHTDVLQSVYVADVFITQKAKSPLSGRDTHIF